jgi:hypothetical protein
VWLRDAITSTKLTASWLDAGFARGVWSSQVQAVRNAAAAEAQKELAKQRTRLRRLEELAESASESLKNLTGTVGDAARDAAAANEAVNGTGTGVISRLLKQVELHSVIRNLCVGS